MKKNKINNTFAFTDRGLSSSGKLLFLLLFSYADKTGTVSDVSIRKMSDQLGISNSCVARNLKQLRKNGYILLQPHYKSNGMRDINTYTIK